ncbi:hypothetical protein OHB14_60895 [Streptomyces sp. NBC_01613]|uniref:hypothetical protein n=1 Tax=Streptomyces sp. NBC_01613 TaxID=2975896 RepID=UPI003868E430
MFTVVLETRAAAPGHVVSLRTSKNWNADIGPEFQYEYVRTPVAELVKSAGQMGDMGGGAPESSTSMYEGCQYTNGPGSDFQSAQGFNLDGRSVFWGGLIP